MKKFFILLTCGLFLSSFTSCSKKEEEKEEANEYGIVEQIVVDADDIQDVITNENDPEKGASGDAEDEIIVDRPEAPEVEIVPQGKVSFNADEAVFEYTDEEIKAFEDFSDGFDKQVLKSLEPLSIAKLWVQAGIQGAWESEYELYAPSTVGDYSKQLQFNAHTADVISTENNPDSTPRKTAAAVMFADLPNAVFVEDSDAVGHLEFTANESEEKVGLAFVKENDVWLLKYYPVISFEAE